MPQPDFRGWAQVELFLGANHADRRWNRCQRFPPLIVAEHPDEPATEKPEERVFEEVLAPMVQRAFYPLP